MSAPGAVRMRAAVARDRPVLRAHWERLLAGWGVAAGPRAAEVRAYLRWLAQERRRRRIHAVVALQGRASVASAVLWLQERQPRPGFDGGAVPRLLYVHVEPGRARDGIAEALVARLVSWCRSRGHDTLHAHLAGGDRGVLERMGFKRTNELWLARPPMRLP